MANAPRTQLEAAVLGHPKTYQIRIKGWDGGTFGYIDLSQTNWSVTSKIVDPDGGYIAPTVTVPTQAGNDRGLLQVPLTGAQLDTEGTWKMNIYIGETSGNEEPITRFYQFEVYADETQA